jgi:phosphatidate cytidylyltransferase
MGGFLWAVYVTGAAIICQTEFFAIMAARGFHGHRTVAAAISAGLILLGWLAGIEFAAGLLTAGILGLLVVHLSRPAIGNVISSISATLAGVLYIGWMLSHGVYLREVEAWDGTHIGLFAVLFALACTFMNDTGGYFAGRALGKHKVAPRISPKKSWEGLAGGIICSGATAALLKFGADRWFDPVPYGYTVWVLLGMTIGVVGFFGDLVESLLKRDADVKDSGTLLPGHGGLLDRVDGVLFTVPFTYYALTFLARVLE